MTTAQHAALTFLVGAPLIACAVWLLRDWFDSWLDRRRAEWRWMR